MPTDNGVLQFEKLTTIAGTIPVHGAAKEGSMYYNGNDTEKKFMFNDGSDWKVLGSSGGIIYSVASDVDQTFWSTNMQWWPLGATHDVTNMTKTIDLNPGNYLIEFSAAETQIRTQPGPGVIPNNSILVYPHIDILIGSGSPTVWTTVCSTTLGSGMDFFENIPITIRAVTNITTAGSYTIKVWTDFQSNSTCNVLLDLNGSKVLSVVKTQ